MGPTSVSTDSERLLRLLESVVLNANDAVLITEAEPIDSPGPSIIYVNPAFTKMTGYSFDEVRGKSPRLLQGPLSGTEAPTKIRAALEAWESIEIELMNYRKDGSTFWVELSISPVADERGWYTHWISVQREITERKDKEEAVARLRVLTLQNEALSAEVKERAVVEAKLSHVAFHDSLTGLRNRLYFLDCLRASVERTQTQEGYKSVVLYMDLDEFKSINDTLGHRVGDLLLMEVALRLRAYARTQDTLARMSGDEFTFLLDNLQDRTEAQAIAERMLAAVQAPLTLGETVLQLTASIGLCEVLSSHREAEEVLRDADLAMYTAKHQGGGRCRFYDHSMHQEAMGLLQTKLQLKAALGHREFELFYQPFVNLQSSVIDGMEALLRWNHPKRGLLGPDKFISLAEQIGQIVPIGSWILRQACMDFKVMQASHDHSLCLSVNVSSRQLDEPAFVKDLAAAIEETGMEPGLLQLEITESIFLKDAKRIGEVFRDIRDLGVKIAFDDFGTGYSSLSYLERYPIDSLKIDQSFVHNPGAGGVNSQIVEMIIKLAKSLGMGVSAEGVETEEQAQTLISLGCPRVQGYLYSKAVPLADMLALLTSGANPMHLSRLKAVD
jgi:diguanylate cyclase (GGDEF)-like protein/PAS domain S-box-containing protein